MAADREQATASPDVAAAWLAVAAEITDAHSRLSDLASFVPRALSPIASDDEVTDHSTKQALNEIWGG